MRLIETRKALSFKNWIKQHDPELKWDFDNPSNLMDQFCSVVAESGDIDLKTIFAVFFANTDSNLTLSQNTNFLEDKY